MSSTDRPATVRRGKDILVNRDGRLLAVFVDGQRIIGLDRKNALLVGAAICRAAAEWDDLPWVVEHV